MRPRVGLGEALQDAQQRGLAAAGGADDDEEFAWRDIEIDILQRHQPLAAADELHAEIFDPNGGGARTHCAWGALSLGRHLRSTVGIQSTRMVRRQRSAWRSTSSAAKVRPDARHRERDDADEQRRHVEGLAGGVDQESEARLRSEQLAHHHADDAAADAEANSGQDVGQRRRQRDLHDDLPPGRAEALGDLDQQGLGGAHAGDGVDENGKNGGQEHHRDLRADADAEPQDEQRRHRDQRRGIERRDVDLGVVAHPLADADDDAERGADHDRQQNPVDQLAEAHPDVQLQLAGLPQPHGGERDIRRRREEQPVGEDGAGQNLPARHHHHQGRERTADRDPALAREPWRARPEVGPDQRSPGTTQPSWPMQLLPCSRNVTTLRPRPMDKATQR